MYTFAIRQNEIIELLGDNIHSQIEQIQKEAMRPLY